MKAVICTKYGSPDVLELVEVPKPALEPGKLLVRVHASAVTTADTMMRSGTPAFARLFLGLKRPKNPLTDGALTSLNFLREVAGLKPGQRVLINGASGGLGTAAVQIAKAIGADVTGVCSGRNADLVLSLGADRAIDYSQEDFTRLEDRYDVIYDTIGKSSFSRCRGVLTEGGIYLSPVLRFRMLFQMLLTARSKGRKARFSATGLRPEPELHALLRDLVALIDQGKLVTVIDRTYPLHEAREAHRYVETGRKRGNVLVIPSPAEAA